MPVLYHCDMAREGLIATDVLLILIMQNMPFCTLMAVPWAVLKCST